MDAKKLVVDEGGDPMLYTGAVYAQQLGAPPEYTTQASGVYQEERALVFPLINLPTSVVSRSSNMLLMETHNVA